MKIPPTADQSQSGGTTARRPAGVPRAAMSIPHQVYLNRAAFIAAVLFAALFLTSLFKHISYPLLWNDEAETASFGQSIIHHGFPKIHDGENVIYPLLHPNLSLGEDGPSDAFIGSGWGGYYFATLGIGLASCAQDLYAKTALLRIPFALLGVGALALCAGTGLIGLRRRAERLAFLAGFLFLETLSVSLVLHLREVRYYSVAIFLSAFLLYSYARYRIAASLSFPVFSALCVGALFLLFNTFIPAYLAVLGLFLLDWGCSFIAALRAEGPEMPFGRKLSGLLVREAKPLLVPLASLITVLPVALFFRSAEISRAIAEQNGFNLAMYCRHLVEIAGTLGSYEFLYLALFAKGAALLCRFLTPGASRPPDDSIAARISDLLGLYVAAYLIAAARLPFIALYERYFIIIQPMISVALVLDSMAIFRLLAGPSFQRRRKLWGLGILVPGLCLFGCTMANKLPSLKGHCYELTHRYYGPLDYAIVYIKENFPHPERLVIATNYEENSYMYYLGGKVTIGYVGKNLRQDLLARPDIIIYRNGRDNFLREFKELWQKGDWESVSFPVADLMVNNIPELRNSYGICHYFETQAAGRGQGLSLLVRRR